MNTQLNYSHLAPTATQQQRKIHTEIIPGELQFDDIKEYLKDGNLFIPNLAGLPAIKENQPHHIAENNISLTPEEPTLPELDATALVQKFAAAAKTGWNIPAPPEPQPKSDTGTKTNVGTFFKNAITRIGDSVKTSQTVHAVLEAGKKTADSLVTQTKALSGKKTDTQEPHGLTHDEHRLRIRYGSDIKLTKATKEVYVLEDEGYARSGDTILDAERALRWAIATTENTEETEKELLEHISTRLRLPTRKISLQKTGEYFVLNVQQDQKPCSFQYFTLRDLRRAFDKTFPEDTQPNPASPWEHFAELYNKTDYQGRVELATVPGHFWLQGNGIQIHRETFKEIIEVIRTNPTIESLQNLGREERHRQPSP
jgi:hypothetical protein